MITVNFKKLDIRPGFKILDIGCGSGRHTSAAYQCTDVNAIGADLNFENLIQARKRLRFHEKMGAHGGGKWALAGSDITCLPFKDNSFDLVICSEVMEHIPEHHTAVKEIIRVLKAGNNLVISVPRYWPERICWALSDDYSHSDNGHIRIYKTKELIAFLESFGLQKWAHHHAHSLHTPFWWLKCLVGPTRKDSALVNLYHRFLAWDIMKQPRGTRLLDDLLNPVLGKSVVIYFRKHKNHRGTRITGHSAFSRIGIPT